MSEYFGNATQIRDFADQIVTEFNRFMFGLDEQVRLCLAAFFTNGHVLLEGAPGLGKTRMVRALADTLALDAGRIQFTPDLMPTDITGTHEPDFARGSAVPEFQFRRGPVLKSSLVLADEINRTTPKTQSAMLEAMEERQVTVLGEQYQTQDPFMVLATENSVDHEGTYCLPEAQLDRFMFQLDMPIPTMQHLRLILQKESGSDQNGKRSSVATETPNPPDQLRAANATQEVHTEIRRKILDVLPAPDLEQHICNLQTVLSGSDAGTETDSKADVRGAASMLRELTGYAIGPRAAIALMLGAKACFLLFAETSAPTASTTDLKRVVYPVLRHRLKLDYSWQARFADRHKLDHERPDLLHLLILDLCMNTAPGRETYGIFQQEFHDLASNS